MLVKVSPIIKDILVLKMSGYKEDEILNKLTEKYPEKEVLTALDEIEKYNKEFNLFDTTRPYFTRATFPYSFEEIEHQLNKKLSHMILDITWDCNLACKYCKYSGIYEGERVNQRLYMKKEIIEKALLFLKDHSIESERVSIGFYGGEPLLAFSNIKYAVLLAKELFKGKNIRFSLTTNGLLLSRKEVRDFLKDHNFSINVSIDGPGEIHDRYRVNKAGLPTFNTIMNALCEFKKEYPDYFVKKVGYIITLAPPFKLKEVMEFTKSWECKTMAPVFASLVDPYDTEFYKNFSKEELQAFDKELEELINESLEKEIPSGYINPFLYQFVFKDAFIYHKSAKGNLSREFLIGGFCIPGYDRTFIAPDGSIYPCEKVHYHLKVGDVYNGFYMNRIREIVNEVEQLRNDHCLDCPISRLCNICYAPIYRNGKLRKDLFKNTCKAKMRSWKQILTTYAKIKEIKPDFFNIYEKMWEVNND